MKSTLAVCLAAGISVLVGACPAFAGRAQTARFDWFAYDGHDPVQTAAAGPGDYRNPILEGFYPDPSIVRVGMDYYLVNSSFSYFPGIPVWHSRDLVHWTQIGNAIDRPSQLNFDKLGISRGVFAPSISFHDGVFYIVNTCVDCGGNYLITATNPAGPWSDPVWLGFDGIDPSLFFDEDGKAWLVNNGPPPAPPLYDGHRAIWIQEFDIAKKSLVGPRSVIVNGGTDIKKKPAWIEGPHLLRHGGKYYLVAAEGGTAEQHSEVVFRSDKVTGPYVPWTDNPILTQRDLDPARPDPVTSTGHADFVATPGGQWWSMFLGTRPYADDSYNTGRETFLLPVEWTADGWPSILPKGAPVPYVHARPDLPPTPPPIRPTSGNFRIRDDFNGTALAPYWVFIRTPHTRWYDLAAGSLVITARPQSIGGLGQPSFIGRRQQHAFASAATAMEYRPEAAGDEAGLVAFQNRDNYFFLGLALDKGEPAIVLKRRAGENDGEDGTTLITVPVHLAAHTRVYLKIKAHGSRYDFSYALSPGAWVVLKRDADGTILSTKRAGGFVGTMLGMYAYTASR